MTKCTVHCLACDRKMRAAVATVAAHLRAHEAKR